MAISYISILKACRPIFFRSWDILILGMFELCASTVWFIWETNFSNFSFSVFEKANPFRE